MLSTFKVLAISQVMGSIFWAACPTPKKAVQGHDFVRFLFYFWFFAEITNIYFVWLDIKNDIKE